MTQFKHIFFAASLTFGLAFSSASAHEFWINPQNYQGDSGSKIIASFHNGENFDGSNLAFFDRSSTRLQVLVGNKITDLTPRNGDRPAIDIDPVGDGLIVLAHETTPSSLTYKTWEKFDKFAKHKDFKDILSKHQARGLPPENFRESYTRHAKALIAVGTGLGADRALGLETEFVARTNPYVEGYSNEMQVQLFYKGTPRADAQVEVFEKSSDGTVTVTLQRTDAQGEAVIQTKPNHSYLLDAVVLRAPEQDSDGIAWETLWAALTFATP